MKLLSPFTHITLVDDIKEEVQDIINTFQDQNIPFTYYQYDGTQSSLPSKSSNNIRVLFMDLYLIEGISQPETVSGTFMNVLDTLLEDNTPYILIVWSKHIQEENEAEEENHDPSFLSLKTRLNNDTRLAPLELIPLDKMKIFELDETGQINPSSAVVNLETAIIEALNKSFSAKPLLHWNNLVGIASNKTLSNTREMLVTKNFDSDFFERLMFEFARAYLGKHNRDVEEKYKSSFHFITDLFQDNLEELINDIPISETIEFKNNSTNPPDENDFALINFKTLVSENKVFRAMPGCVFEKKKEDFDFYHKGFYSDIFDIRSKTSELINDGQTKTEAGRSAKFFFKEICNELKFITANITPVCDNAQNKYVYHKYCHGVILPVTFTGCEYLKTNANYLYKSPIFLFEESQVELILDFRLITDDLCDAPKEEEYIFRLREGILMDIQYKLSNHMGRPGIVFLDKNFL